MPSAAMGWRDESGVANSLAGLSLLEDAESGQGLSPRRRNEARTGEDDWKAPMGCCSSRKHVRLSDPTPALLEPKLPRLKPEIQEGGG